MRKLQVLLIATVAAVCALGSAASGITYGEPDAGEHPYVGFIIYFVPSEPGWFSCSGTLLDADTFLTAGHCVFGVGTDGEDIGPTGGTDIWVTFDETDVLAGWPARTPDISEEDLYAARRAWLEANGFTQGTAIPDPAYDDFASFPATHDVGVVELSSPVTMSTYGELAPIGTVEQMVGPTGRGSNSALVETVGYGIQSIQPNPMDIPSRYKSTSRIVETRGNFAQGGNLHTLNNPSRVGGRGGSCFGDSGGPVFVNDTNLVLAVVSFGNSGTCHGADYSWRVDTEPSYDFLLPYIT